MHEPPTMADSFTSIETDIHAMEEFAATLANEVATGYAPHLDQVITSMLTTLPKGGPDFQELADFMALHREVQQQTFSNAFNFRDGTHQFARVAETISAEYAESDAFARAKVADVHDGFDAANQPYPETGVDH